LAAFSVKSLLLFGSAAKGSANAESDLDFLVEFEGRATFDGYMELDELLRAEFQTDIDLVTMRALHPVLREQIFAEAVRVA
jgi:predicted nucleotidyltransferase